MRVLATTSFFPDLVTMHPATNRAGPSGPVVGTEASPSAGRPIRVVTWGADEREVAVGAGAASWLVVRENANAGWVATLNGRTLTPGIVDGWQQAFVVPAGKGGELTLVFAPERPFRDGLVFGGLSALGVVLLAALPTRRRRSGRHARSRERATGCRPDRSEGVSAGRAPRREGGVVRRPWVLALAAIGGVVGLVMAATLRASSFWVGGELGDSLPCSRFWPSRACWPAV